MLKNDIILMCGLPASGKSSLVYEYEKLGYTIFSCDSKTMTNAADIISLRGYNKIVIDNTNTIATTRKIFIDYAKKHNLSIGIHYMNTSKDDCLINSLHRMYKRYGKIFLSASDVSKNPPSDFATNNFVIAAIFAMDKKFDKISKTEGFDDIEITKFQRNENWGYTNKAIFVDLDGTVRKSIGVEPYPIEKDDIVILKNSSDVLKKYKEAGYKIIAVTNQSGVTKKTLTEQKVVELIKETNKQLDGVIDDYHYCPHLPPSTICYCRKPQSGMGVLMMHKHQLDIKNCIMVGDAASDKTFGVRLGMNYYHPDEFFNR